MAQVIIFENDLGSVSVCTPSGSLNINEVLVKDCPANAIIVDDSTLPESENDFFNAWELNGSTISVNIQKAILFQQSVLNNIAKTETQHRMTNNGSGISNKLSDSEWLSLLTTARTAISAATTTQELRDALLPVQTAITENA